MTLISYVEEEMLMRKYYEFMAAQGLTDKEKKILSAKTGARKNNNNEARVRKLI
ncbi:hypothetical protein CASFOL_027179 [Castilleja foliolosa]|uniref:Uncharacterized protein n=1 Tax=Castilleja foliolosa TaxID=1961234 RepID=A0ABD3CE29_9LAMI